MTEYKHRDETWLRERYLEDGLSTREIAEMAGVYSGTVSKWLNKFDIPTRPEGRHRTVQMGVRTDERGYEVVQHREPNGSVVKVRVHRLLAVAEYGLDAIAGKVVHHRNGVKWDNRPSNIEPMSHSEHSRLHAAEQPWMVGSRGEAT